MSRSPEAMRRSAGWSVDRAVELRRLLGAYCGNHAARVGEVVSHYLSRIALQPALYRAPGRVNLIGEHTDYNQGLVCPIAIEMACYIAIAPPNHGLLRLYSEEMGESREFPIGKLATTEQQHDWSDYVVGVAQMLVRDGHAVGAERSLHSQRRSAWFRA